MRFRLGLMIGAGIGYVLGAKAGRERFEQIVRSWRRFWASSTGRAISDKGREVTEGVRELAGKGMEAASSSIKKTVGRSNGAGEAAPMFESQPSPR
jgi:hypothetical protein